MNFVLFYGSYRRHRVGIRVARYVERRLATRGHHVTLVDARETGLPILDLRYKDYPRGEAPPELERLATLYRAADGFLLVAGEYNHGLQPGLKNLLDHFLEEYFWRPSAIVSYSAGMFGGVRAAVQLRAPLCELGMPSIPSVLPIPRIEAALNEEGRPAEPDGLARRFNRFATELEWYAEALREQRKKGMPY